MDLMQLAVKAFMSQMQNQGNTQADSSQVTEALSGLLPTSGGNLDVQGLMGKLDGGDLMSLAASWLGDGQNENMSAEQAQSLFGQEQISEFAGKLGMDQNQAADGLSNMIPDLIDQSSSGGSLLKSIGGSLLGKLFNR